MMHRIKNKVLKKENLLALHPFIIVLLPILFIASRNMSEVPIKECCLTTLYAMIMTGILFFTIQLFTKQKEKTSCILTTCYVALFSYGPLYELSNSWFSSSPWALLAILASLETVIAIVCLVFFIQKSTRLSLFNRFFCFFSLFFLVSLFFSVSQNPLFFEKLKKIPVWLTTPLADPVQVHHTNVELPSLTKTPYTDHPVRERFPDIYYLILDGYARTDNLKTFYDYDNSQFETQLENLGFYIAKKSTANYPQTHLSLASSLNMDYINTTIERCGNDHYEPYFELIRTPKVAQLLKEQGYQYITISSGWGPTQFASVYSDHHYHRSLNLLSNYHQSILMLTPLKHWLGLNEARLRLYAFEKMMEIPLRHKEKPKFVFLHLVMPHPPYLFDQNGRILEIAYKNNPFDQDKEGYIEQIRFLNKKIIAICEQLVTLSPSPIIILQADHGSHSTLDNLPVGRPSLTQIKERFAILNAYYGPAEFQSKLYPTLSPVNSFRILLNYLNLTHYPLLADTNHFLWIQKNAPFIDVTSEVQALQSHSHNEQALN